MTEETRIRVGPRYAGDEQCLHMKWPDVFDDFIMLAHPWAQYNERETRGLAEDVLRRHGWRLETEEALREFLDAFGKPYEKEEGRYIPQDVRDYVMDRDGGACVACGARDNLSFDHKKPFSRGGRSTRYNLQVLCCTCNSSKGARTMAEWRGCPDDG